MRQFYAVYPIYATVSHKLSWSIVVELLKIDDPLERSFYEKQSILENWTVRELQRQKKTSLFLRLAFISKYQLYLPDREELRLRLEQILSEDTQL